MDITNRLNLIKNIKLPETNVYFEKVSPDGYAFHGLSLVILNQKEKAREFFNIIKKLNYEFSVDIDCIRAIEKNDKIIYTQFWCYLLCYSLNEKEECKKIYNNISSVEFYSNGFIKYSLNYKHYYSVPNIMPMLALIELLHNKKKTDKFNKIINKLSETMIEGNWVYLEKNLKNNEWYPVLGDKNLPVFEDISHLVLMYICFLKIIKIDKNEIINNMINSVKKRIIQYIESGNINTKIDGIWCYSFAAFALMKINPEHELCSYYKKQLLNTNGVKHENYRVRAISAYVLASLI